MTRIDKTRGFKAAPLKIHEPENYFIRLFSSQRFVAIVALAFLVLLSFPLAKSYSRRVLVDKEIADMKNKVSEFEQENKEMKELLEYLSSKESAEEQARLNLNLKKPGEAVVIVEPLITSEENSIKEEEEPCSNFKKWWRYFFD